MADSRRRTLGGGNDSTRFLLIYAGGVVVGSAVRVARFLLPDRVLEFLRARLLP